MARKRISKKVKTIVREYSDRLAKEDHLPIDRVIVFGSRVKGTARTWSDIDACIISPQFNDPFRAWTFLWKKRNTKEVLAGLEPVGFTPKDFREGGALIDEIKRTGVAVR